MNDQTKYLTNKIYVMKTYRVVCIDASKGNKSGCTPSFKEGDILHCIDRKLNHCIVFEYPICNCPIHNGRTVRKIWRKDRFIPLSNIDETEIVKNRESLINQ